MSTHEPAVEALDNAAQDAIGQLAEQEQPQASSNRESPPALQASAPPQRRAARQAQTSLASQLKSSPALAKSKASPRKPKSVDDSAANLDARSDSTLTSLEEEPATKKPVAKRAPRKSAPGVLSSASSTSASASSFPDFFLGRPLGLNGKKPIQYGGQRTKKVVLALGTASKLAKSRSLDSSEGSLSPSPTRHKSLPTSAPSSPLKRRRVSSTAASPTRRRKTDDDGDLQASPKKKRRTVSKKPSNIGKSTPVAKRPPPRASTGLTSIFSKKVSLLPHTEDPMWDLNMLSSVVWIKISENGDVVDDMLEGPSIGAKYLWWPGKLQEDSNSPADGTKISLLGEITPGGATKSDLTIKTPSVTNLLSFRSNDKQSAIRFNASNFIVSTPSSDEQKAGDDALTTDWKAAYQEAMLLDEKENDDLPDPSQLSALKHRSPVKNDVARGLTDDEDDLPVRPSPIKKLVWIPDFDIHIDSLVVALDKRGGTFWWPAKVTSVNHPKKGASEGTYSLVFCDGTKKDVPRSWILTPEDEGFYGCKIGPLARGEKRGERMKADDGSHMRESPRPRSPSPDFANNTHLTSDQFTELSLREQIAWIRPVLQGILDDTNVQAKPRNELFRQGGKSRARLLQMIEHGDLTDDQVNDVLEEIRRFVLRGDRWAEKDVDGDALMENAGPDGMAIPPKVVENAAESPVKDETTHKWMPSAKFPRLSGISWFESLSRSERSQYCSDVLLPEAIIHLCAWRHGLYDDTQNPTSEDQDAIYKKAVEELRKGYPDKWVDDILLMRQMLGTAQPSFSKVESPPLTGGTRSRRAYK